MTDEDERQAEAMTPLERERQEHTAKRLELLDLLSQITGRAIPRSLGDHAHAVAVVRSWIDGNRYDDSVAADDESMSGTARRAGALVEAAP
jgi:hypothetical protein